MYSEFENAKRLMLVGVLLVMTVVISMMVTETIARAEEAADSEPRALALVVGGSLFIDLEGSAERVAVSDPEVAEAVAVTPRQIMLRGQRAGSTTLVVWDQAGTRRVHRVEVHADVAPLRRALRELFPSEPIQASAMKDSVALSGLVSSESVAAQVVDMARQFNKNVVNLLRTAPAAAKEEPQILLQVRFAEVDRSVGKDLGANLLSTGALNMPGLISTQQFGATGLGRESRLHGAIRAPVRGTPSEFSLSDLLNVFAFRPDLNLAVAIKALQSKGLFQILAEPNLITRNGHEASFLAGGKFPYAVVNASSGSAFPAVHVQFEEFGIRLQFTPQITRSGTILLKVKPEVSDLDFTNAITISGFVLPSIRTRRAETEIELRDGQSFAIAGLMDNRVTQQYNKIPFLGDVPVLGMLFKSKSLKKSNAELLVLVTPQIIKPLEFNERPPLPEVDAPFLRAPRPEGAKPGGDTPRSDHGSDAQHGENNSDPSKSARTPEPSKKEDAP